MTAPVVFAAVGTYGDLHPFMAVALEMQARGRPVLLLAAEDYAEKVRAAGLPFAPMRPGTAEITAAGFDHAAYARRLQTDDRFLFREILAPTAEAGFEDARPHVEGAALVVVNHFAFGPQIAAELAGVPAAVLVAQPLALFSAHDPPVLPGAPWLPALRRRLGPGAVRPLLDLGLRLTAKDLAPVQRLRAKLGLPAGGSWFEAGATRALATVGLWSPLLGGVQPDHPPGTVVVGAAIYDDEPLTDPDEAVDAFLAAGAPPVVLTLGSYAGQSPGEFYSTGIAAARRLGLRTIVVGGPNPPEGLGALAAPDTLVAAYVRYSRLFPRARLVVHHGGAGTCHQALRAGVPQLVTPIFGDQPDNARRLEGLGVARTVPLRRFDVERAAKALTELVRPETAARAAELAPVVAAERGAERAADVLEGVLERAAGGAPASAGR